MKKCKPSLTLAIKAIQRKMIDFLYPSPDIKFQKATKTKSCMNCWYKAHPSWCTLESYSTKNWEELLWHKIKNMNKKKCKDWSLSLTESWRKTIGSELF